MNVNLTSCLCPVVFPSDLCGYSALFLMDYLHEQREGEKKTRLNSFSVHNPFPALLGVQRRQVHEEDADRGSLHLVGQGGHEEESGQLAQALRQLHPDQPLNATPKKEREKINGDAGEVRMYEFRDPSSRNARQTSSEEVADQFHSSILYLPARFSRSKGKRREKCADTRSKYQTNTASKPVHLLPCPAHLTRGRRENTATAAEPNFSAIWGSQISDVFLTAAPFPRPTRHFVVWVPRATGGRQEGGGVESHSPFRV